MSMSQDHTDWHTIANAEGTSAFRCPFDCMAGFEFDDYDEDVEIATPAATVTTAHHVAKFHRAAWADAFAASISGPGWYATNVARKKGNIVEFDTPATSLWHDYAEHVGYHGSPNNPGSLDGRRAPACY
jgi:hypothetical protein